MAPSSHIVVALIRLSSASLEEQSLLQMPVAERIVATEASDCRCPGYNATACRENAFQGCIWTDAGESDSPWCQCDPNFQGTPPLFTSPAAPSPPVYPGPPTGVFQSPPTAVGFASGNACAFCNECEANPSSSQAVNNDQCAPCANDGQSWWPCNVDGVCRCAGSGGETPPPAPAPAPAPQPAPAPAPPSADNGKCTSGPDDCSFTAGAGISSWFTQDLFNQMFPNICSNSCHGCEMLSYNCLIKATLEYPELSNSGDIDDDKRELAAWMGIMGQETTGGGCADSTELAGSTDAETMCSCGQNWCDDDPNGGCSGWGLCFVEEASGLYCTPNSVYPCVAGQEYKGRGPKQLSYNYNYGQFSEEYCGDKNILLNNPGWVASNPTLAWASSLWFWFSGGACLPGERCKPAPHDVFTGSRTMCQADLDAGRKYGLGWATNIVNGGLECPGNGRCDSRVHSRVRFYEHYCDVLGVDPKKAGWDDDNLFCSNQLNYVASPPTEC